MFGLASPHATTACGLPGTIMLGREAREEGVEEGVEFVGVVDEEGVADAVHFLVGAVFDLLLHLFDGA